MHVGADASSGATGARRRRYEFSEQVNITKSRTTGRKGVAKARRRSRAEEGRGIERFTNERRPFGLNHTHHRPAQRQ